MFAQHPPEHNTGVSLSQALALYRASDRRIPQLAAFVSPKEAACSSSYLPQYLHLWHSAAVSPLALRNHVRCKSWQIRQDLQESCVRHTGTHVRKQICCVTKCSQSTWGRSQCKALTNTCPTMWPHMCQESSNPRDIALTLRKPPSNSPAPTRFLCDPGLQGRVSEP